MNVVYHPRYEEVYSGDPAAEAGRMEAILDEVSQHFNLVQPEPASPDDIRLVHSYQHLEHVKRLGLTYEIALLATGGAIKAADLAMDNEASFGLIRPPGHHASPDHCWGFCFFNNLAISLERLLMQGKINRTIILDFDLHFGDGTENIFRNVPEISYFHPESYHRQGFVDSISELLAGSIGDIIAVSAGFDRHERDWGGLLTTEDYEMIGKLVKGFSERECHGRRYGVLEGGYNHNVLGKNVKAFLDGMD